MIGSTAPARSRPRSQPAHQAYRRRRPVRVAAAALTIVILAFGWFAFAPPQLGGKVSYVVTDGVSMLPHFHAGDLVVLRKESAYHVGEVAAYHNKQLGVVVMHRIIARDGSHFVFKGDNNSFDDAYEPTAAQIVGGEWIHIPRVGDVVQYLRIPLVAAGGLGILWLFAFGPAAVPRRRRRRHAMAADHVPSHKRHSALRVTALASGASVFGFLALVAAVAAGIGYSRPTTTLANSSISYSQSGRLTYSANVSPSSVYGTDRVSTGEPLYGSVVKAVTFTYTYVFETPAASALTGTLQLAATVNNGEGLVRTIPLGGFARFTGDRVVSSATIELSTLTSVAKAFDRTGNSLGGSYSMAIVPTVKLAGRVGLESVHLGLNSPIVLGLSSNGVFPPTNLAAGTSSLHPTLGNLSAGTSGTLVRATPEPSKLFGRVPVADLRRWSVPVGGVALFICCLFLFALARRFWSKDEGARIATKYSSMLIEVKSLPSALEIVVLTLVSIDDLVAISRRFETPILHERSSNAYGVLDNNVLYRYETGSQLTAVDLSRVSSSTPAPS